MEYLIKVCWLKVILPEGILCLCQAPVAYLHASDWISWRVNFSSSIWKSHPCFVQIDPGAAKRIIIKKKTGGGAERKIDPSSCWKWRKHEYYIDFPLGPMTPNSSSNSSWTPCLGPLQWFHPIVPFPLLSVPPWQKGHTSTQMLDTARWRLHDNSWCVFWLQGSEVV